MRVQAPRRWLVYLAAAGPGLIAAAAGNDAGGIVTYSSAGAQFVYRTLFLMVLITVAYVIVQEMVARLSVHTGKGLAALIREEFSLRLTAFAIIAFAIANVGLMVTVSPHASADEVAGQLIEARRHSMVVVDENGCPIGRILADDVLDALVPTKGRFHFPRLLS